MKPLLRLLVAILLCTVIQFTHGADEEEPPPLKVGDDVPVYKTGYPSIMALGRDLFGSLKPAQKETISSHPISIETAMVPFARMLFYADEVKPVRGVWISAGFIDLVNRVAHAKAIDTLEKGYFKKYIDILAKETGETLLQDLPNDTNIKYWSDDILNEQQSNFNSIVGIVVGIKLAHHYLGHFDKYKDKISTADGISLAPINNLITPAEWEAAFNKGVRNALEAGCLVEGVVPFYEAFDKMAKRPAWSVYFLPENSKFAKVRKDLEKAQKKFLNGEE